MNVADRQATADFRAALLEVWERDREEILAANDTYAVIILDGDTPLSHEIVEEAVRGLPFVIEITRSLPTTQIPFKGWRALFRPWRVYGVNGKKRSA